MHLSKLRKEVLEIWTNWLEPPQKQTKQGEGPENLEV
jgi:hypothetical protein